MARLIAIAYKHSSQAPMTLLPTADVTLNHGVEKDHYGKPSQRQVTVLSMEQWQQACSQLDVSLSWTTRRANLLVEGLEFSTADIGKILSIGKLKLMITGETDPCAKMEAAHTGLFAALAQSFRGGVTCRVLNDAVIAQGDMVSLD